MVVSDPFIGVDIKNAVTTWLINFETAISKNNSDAVSLLFVENGHWRDLLAFTWHIRTVNGPSEIKSMVQETAINTGATGIKIAQHRTPPRVVDRGDTVCIEAFIEFNTKTGPASGILRLIRDSNTPDNFKAWVLMTSLEGINGHEEAIG